MPICKRRYDCDLWKRGSSVAPFQDNLKPLKRQTRKRKISCNCSFANGLVDGAIAIAYGFDFEQGMCFTLRQ
jgi:hypothetical protein